MHNDSDKIKNSNTADNTNEENKIENINANDQNTQTSCTKKNNIEIIYENDEVNLNELSHKKKIKMTSVSVKDTSVSVKDTSVSVKDICNLVNETSTNNSQVSSKNSQVSSKKSQVSSKKSQVSSKKSQVSSKNSQVSSKKSQVSSKNSQVSSKNSQVSTNNSQASTNNIQASTNNSQASTNNSQASTNNSQASTNNSQVSTNNSQASSKSTVFTNGEMITITNSKSTNNTKSTKNSDKTDISQTEFMPLTGHGYNKNISTFIRIKDHCPVSEITKRSLRVDNKTYYADQVLIGLDQTQMFDLIRNIILEKAIKGYNCSVFAYGQTGSGKTYTIQGTEENPGIIVRTLVYLHGLYNSLRFSFVEIYNENLIDLFNPERTIAIREDPLEGVVVINSTVIESDCVEKSVASYSRGLLTRKTASTEMNANSSRSHCIFTIFLGFRDHGMSKKSRLCIVDLAGSEKYREGVYERIKETCNINKSLLCLGKIVNKLSSGDGGHISYRDSKLTFILKDALGGNSKLAIIGNVCLRSAWDTANTLMFLQRTKLLNNNPLINYGTCEASVGELMENLKMLDEENVNLKEEIKALQKRNKTEMPGSALFVVKELEKSVAYVKKKLLEMKKIFEKLNFADYDAKRRILLEIDESLKKKNAIEKEEIRKLGKEKEEKQELVANDNNR